MACILRTLVKTSLTLTSMRLRTRGDAESGAGTTRGAREEQEDAQNKPTTEKEASRGVETCALISLLFACEIKVSQSRRKNTAEGFAEHLCQTDDAAKKMSVGMLLLQESARFPSPSLRDKIIVSSPRRWRTPRARL